MDVVIKQLRNNEWHIIPNATYKGMTPRDLLLSFDNTDTVCEIKTTAGLCYWCGKEKYCVAMRNKGHIAMTCLDAANLYPEYKAMLETCIDVFGEREELRNERYAIQKAEKVPESIIKETCDKYYGVQGDLTL